MNLTETLSQDELDLVSYLTPELERGGRQLFDSIGLEEKKRFLKLLKRADQEGIYKTYTQLWEQVYEVKPMPIEKWLEDEYYVGKFIKRNLWDKWKEEICEVINNGIVEWVICGSIGSGKTTAAFMPQLYKLYQLECMKDPADYYSSTTLVFGVFSISVDLAEKVGRNIVTSRLLESPYFRTLAGMELEEFSRKQQREILDLPKRIKFVFGSRGTHILGQDVIGCNLDEVAFSSSPDSKQIKDLYNGVKRRIVSRFLDKYGRIPGIVCLVSSANYEGDFLDTHIREVCDDPKTRITPMAVYDVKKYDGPRFRVQVGDKFHSSKILDSVIIDTRKDASLWEVRPTKLEAPPEAKVIEVPVHFFKDFENDIEGALRDIAGIALFTSSPLLHNRDIIYSLVNKDRLHPFTLNEVPVNIDDKHLTLESVFIKERMFEKVDAFRNIHRVLVHPESPRFIHVDLAYHGDAAGIAICHLSGVKEVARYDAEHRAYTTRAPIVYIDMMLKCPSTKGSEIDFEKIRTFILYLFQLGMPIGRVSYDSFQSVDSRQILIKQNIEAELLSVDLKPDPYMALKSCILEERIDYYDYNPFLTELAAIQRVDVKMPSGKFKTKIDHPPSGSKDVSDAVAGAVFSCITSDYADSRLADPGVIVGAREANTAFEPSATEASNWVIGEYDEEGITAILND